MPVIVVGISTLSMVEHYKMGLIIQEAINNSDKNIVYIASGDLSHRLQESGPYGYIEEGPLYDKQVIDVLSNKEFNKLLSFKPTFLDKAAICGHNSFVIMAGVLNNYSLESKFYSHEDITGVGYGILSYKVVGINTNNNYLDIYLNEEENIINNKINNQDEYVMLARNSINEYITNNKIIDIPNNISDELLNNKKGVFVSIHKFNNLRGCIGTIMATKDNIAKEIIDNAIKAATSDFRFNPITIDELKYLDITVDVLNDSEEINDIRILKNME